MASARACSWDSPDMVNDPLAPAAAIALRAPAAGAGKSLNRRTIRFKFSQILLRIRRKFAPKANRPANLGFKALC
jgi:hypothetical protein